MKLFTFLVFMWATWIAQMQVFIWVDLYFSRVQLFCAFIWMVVHFCACIGLVVFIFDDGANNNVCMVRKFLAS